MENPCMNEWLSSLSYEVKLTCQFQMSAIISSGLPPKAYIGEDNFKLQKTQENNTHLYSSEVVWLNSSVALKISHDTLVWPINCTCSLFLSLLFWVGEQGCGGGNYFPFNSRCLAFKWCIEYFISLLSRHLKWNNYPTPLIPLFSPFEIKSK